MTSLRQSKLIVTFRVTRHPNGLPEERYNRAHKRARNTVERDIGIWGKAISLSLITKLHLIVATAILYNIAVQGRDQEMDEDIHQMEIPVTDIDYKYIFMLSRLRLFNCYSNLDLLSEKQPVVTLKFQVAHFSF